MSLIPSAAWEAWAGGAEGQGGAASEAPGLGIPWSTSWGEDPLLGFGTLELSVSMSRGRGASGRGACGDGEGSAERAVQEPVWEKHSQGLPAFSCEQVRVTSSLCLQQRLIDSSRSPDAPLWPNPTSACAWESSWCTSQGPERVTKHGGRNHKGRDYLGPSHKARDGPLGAAGVFLSEHLRSAPAGPSSAPAPAAGPLVPPACSRHRPWAACFQLRRGQGRQRPETLPRSASPDLGAELSGSEAEEFLPALESS
ncbi:uncharacterized protein LOC103662638 isoform X3 [Ursus maritimus]|uniref:Uncharacterized protein LOC103662638 isoform X3 n=1 Tax=Ursus maritimus TaxID=29073 RepID=A0A384C282_URSMA|nr:uncharacterized protein LOC103662638 isoform X3 [Ursus maritimus]